MAYVNNLFIFLIGLLRLNALQYRLSSVFQQFFTWTALDEADLHFSLILVAKPTAAEGELRQPRDCIINVINPYTRLIP
jgi:hypothetical protein